MANPMSDQILAAVDHVSRVCPNNRHLVEDALLGEVVRRSVGRPMSSEEIDGRVEMVARLIPANPNYIAVPLDEGGVRNLIGGCDRCTREGVRAVARLWIPAGSAVVEIEVCQSCRDFIDDRFSPVAWMD